MPARIAGLVARGRPRKSPERQTELTMLYAIKEAAHGLVARDPHASFEALEHTVTAFLAWQNRRGGDRRFGPR